MCIRCYMNDSGLSKLTDFFFLVKNRVKCVVLAYFRTLARAKLARSELRLSLPIFQFSSPVTHKF